MYATRLQPMDCRLSPYSAAAIILSALGTVGLDLLTANKYLLSCSRVPLAGVDRADVRLSADGDVLTIAGTLYATHVLQDHKAQVDGIRTTSAGVETQNSLSVMLCMH